MNVSEAVAARTTIRRFTDQSVDDDLVKVLLEKSARAPSGGNLQPWRIYVITSGTMTSFLEHVQQSEFQKVPEYPIYPADLKSPYRDSRFKVGEDMYGLLGIPREDKTGALAISRKILNFLVHRQASSVSSTSAWAHRNGQTLACSYRHLCY